MIPHVRRAGLLVSISLLMPTLLVAYGGDTHYYLRFATGLETCFNWDEAHLIASADYLLDKNRTTTAEKQPVQTHNKINWHAFGHSEERFNELWQRVELETDPELQLVKLGQFLHFATDWESHYGYGVRMGHGLPTIFGRDPDSFANDRMNNMRMIGQTLDHMVRVCVMQGRKTDWSEDPDRLLAELAEDLRDEDLLDELYEFNSRRWKLFGYRGKKSKEILARNHLLIEQLIERRGRSRPERKIPSDFTPGDPERGLPPPIALRYNTDGEVIAVYGVEIELMPEYDGTELSASEEEAFEESVETELVDDLEATVQGGQDLDLYTNVELVILDANLAPNGWLVEAAIRNLGPGPSPEGTLDVFVVDVASEQILGQESKGVPSLVGREESRVAIFVKSDGEPHRRILVGASLQVFDLSAQGNDQWFAPWQDELRGELGKRNQEESREPGEVGVLGTPKAWVDSDGDFWLAVHALVSGGDSSRRLGTVRTRLLGGRGELLHEVQHDSVVWTSASDSERGVVPARAFLSPPSREAFCRALRKLRGGSNARIEVSIRGGNALPFEASYPMPPEVVARAQSRCG
jgi:hypothetical protein